MEHENSFMFENSTFMENLQRKAYYWDIPMKKSKSF